MWQSKCVEVNNAGQYFNKEKNKWISVSRLGQKGWELVNVFYDASDSKRYAWLKRQQGERIVNMIPFTTDWDEV